MTLSAIPTGKTEDREARLAELEETLRRLTHKEIRECMKAVEKRYPGFIREVYDKARFLQEAENAGLTT